jgi:hypothetical protein
MPPPSDAPGWDPSVAAAAWASLKSLVGDVMSLSTGTPARNQGPGSSLPGPAAGHPLQRAGRLAAGQPELS